MHAEGSVSYRLMLSRLVAIDTVQFIIENHNQFQFLACAEDSRHRTTFYTVCQVER